MGVQIIHHQRDLLCSLIVFGNILEKLRPIHFGLALRYLGHPLSGQRLTRHEHVTDTATLVLVKVPTKYVPHFKAGLELRERVDRD